MLTFFSQVHPPSLYPQENTSDVSNSRISYVSKGFVAFQAVVFTQKKTPCPLIRKLLSLPSCDKVLSLVIRIRWALLIINCKGSIVFFSGFDIFNWTKSLIRDRPGMAWILCSPTCACLYDSVHITHFLDGVLWSNQFTWSLPLNSFHRWVVNRAAGWKLQVHMPLESQQRLKNVFRGMFSVFCAHWWRTNLCRTETFRIKAGGLFLQS